jgi:hypothetical protein
MKTAHFNVPFALKEKSEGTKSDSAQTNEEATSSTESGTSTTTALTVPVGEYYYTGSETASVYSEMNCESDVVTSLKNGDIITVTRTVGDFGCVNIEGSDAWIVLSDLEYAGKNEELARGDINGDGVTDAVDLAILNDYIRSCSELPEGISTLRRCEREAADVSGDGCIDNNDVLIYLMLICE